jgi:hypothetical protein
MDEILYREEMICLERSHIAWLRERDRNTKKFHMKASGHAKKNKIKRLRRDDGSIVTEKKEMECLARNFFNGLYEANQDVQPAEIMQLFQPQVTSEMNRDLCKEFTKEEISDALFQI